MAKPSTQDENLAGEFTGSSYPSLNWTDASAACRNNSITRWVPGKQNKVLDLDRSVTSLALSISVRGCS